MNKNRSRKKKYVRPTTTAIVTPGKILAFGNNNSSGTGSSSANAPYIDIVIDEADSYDGDILMK